MLPITGLQVGHAGGEVLEGKKASQTHRAPNNSVVLSPLGRSADRSGGALGSDTNGGFPARAHARAAVVAICLVGVFGASPLTAEPTTPLASAHIAVLEFAFAPNAQLKAPEAASDSCRGAVVVATRPAGAFVLTRENMLDVLKRSGGRCSEGDCDVETARNLGVDYFVSGSVDRIDGRYVLTLKAHETRRGQLLASKRTSAASELELLDRISPVTQDLMTDAFGRLIGATPKKAMPATDGQFKESQAQMDFGDPWVLVHFAPNPDGSSVEVDGTPLCTATPCSRRVPRGRHKATFAKAHYGEGRVTFEAEPNLRVTATLEPRFANLSILTTPPGVQVTVPGVGIERTPVNNLMVDAGEVRVSVADPCYENSGSDVRLSVGERRSLQLDVRPRTATVLFEVEGDAGRNVDLVVVLNGVEVGRSSGELRLPLCVKEIEVRGDDAERHRFVVPRLKEDEVNRVHLDYGSVTAEGRRRALSARLEGASKCRDDEREEWKECDHMSARFGALRRLAWGALEEDDIPFFDADGDGRVDNRERRDAVAVAESLGYLSERDQTLVPFVAINTVGVAPYLLLGALVGTALSGTAGVGPVTGGLAGATLALMGTAAFLPVQQAGWFKDGLGGLGWPRASDAIPVGYGTYAGGALAALGCVALISAKPEPTPGTSAAAELLAWRTACIAGTSAITVMAVEPLVVSLVVTREQFE